MHRLHYWARHPYRLQLALVGYVVCSLVAHWAYGFTLGSVFEYSLERVDTRIGGRPRVE